MSNRSKIYGLDGLRTLALLGVLLFHTFPQQIPGGYFGVILFFVISGFLTGISSASQGHLPVFPYYKKRFLRIYPQLIFVVFVTLGVISFADMLRLAHAYEETASIFLAYNNFWQIGTNADYFANLSGNSAFTHLWYIAILVQFELLWPFLYMLYRKNRRLFGLLVLLSLFVLPVRLFVFHTPLTSLYYSTDTRIHALLIGAWAGLRHARSRRRLRVKPILALPAGLLFIIITVTLYLTCSGTVKAVYMYGMQVYALLCTGIILICTYTRNRLGKLLDLPFCQYLSRYSYEIYLWQYPVLVLFSILNMNTGLYYILQLAVILGLSIWTKTFFDSLLRKISAPVRTKR